MTTQAPTTELRFPLPATVAERIARLGGGFEQMKEQILGLQGYRAPSGSGSFGFSKLSTIEERVAYLEGAFEQFDARLLNMEGKDPSARARIASAPTVEERVIRLEAVYEQFRERLSAIHRARWGL